ncbi:MAG: riboflavin synthase, partial [Lysobacteraceae bacterium]
MFTGIIEGVGTLASLQPRGGDARLAIAVGSLPFEQVRLGESIAVNGVCLTVVAFDASSFEADASNETLSLTTLGGLATGALLNLERAMRPSDRLGGHLVSGHV